MTIKKQFFLLATLIVTIPLLCILYSLLHFYLASSERLIISGFREAEKKNIGNLSQKEWDNIKEKLKSLPSDVESIFILEDDNKENLSIIFSTMEEFNNFTEISVMNFWSIVRKSSEEYFYQFSAPKTSEHNYLVLTRIKRFKSEKTNNRLELYQSLIVFLFIIVFILLLFIINISKNIFSSISILEKNMQSIADGHLEESNSKIKTTQKANEITSISNNLEKMRCSLLEAQNKKNKLIMGISHDLRTPVAVIKGYTEAISDGVMTTPEEIQSSLELIATKTTQLESMIDSLINFTKLESMEIRDNLIPTSITKIIKDFVNEAENNATVFKRNFISSININEDIYIPLNEQLVLRALQNLYGNALRYTNDNDTIEISASVNDETLLISIADTGIGIDKKDLNNIFDLFYRGTTSRREEGMGIGLSVVKNIIETHGWNIIVESEKGKGSTFTISIPINLKN